MLILSRQRSESVIVSIPPSTTTTQVAVMVTDIRGDKVRLGFTMPDCVTVHRQEVQEAIDRDLRQGPTYRGVEMDPT